jgi:cellulose synthase/poly-beta-1,6-N-acetylglucosamine synthase-like glycosyltransferase
LLEIGGFNEQTLTEDREVAFNIQNHGYKIENSMNSIVLTNTPNKLGDLIKQRRRWYAGFIEDSNNYKHFFFNKKKGFLGTFLLPANIISTFSLLFLSFYGLYNLAEVIISFISNLTAINFNIFSMFKIPDLTASLFSINVFSILGIIFLGLSLLIIFYSVKSNNQRLDLKNNIFDYLSYLLFYSILMSLFWSDSIIYKLFFRNEKRGWSYGS